MEQYEKIALDAYNKGYDDAKNETKKAIETRLSYIPETFLDIPEVVAIISLVRKVI